MQNSNAEQLCTIGRSLVNPVIPYPCNSCIYRYSLYPIWIFFDCQQAYDALARRPCLPLTCPPLRGAWHHDLFRRPRSNGCTTC